MIAAVRGILAGKTLDSALVNVGGVTLRIFAPLSVLSRLNTGEEVTLHTWLLVREDALALYGFASPDDRDLFEQLLAVGGVGPRIGLALRVLDARSEAIASRTSPQQGEGSQSR